jgi:hypothetical protein
MLSLATTQLIATLAPAAFSPLMPSSALSKLPSSPLYLVVLRSVVVERDPDEVRGLGDPPGDRGRR